MNSTPEQVATRCRGLQTELYQLQQMRYLTFNQKDELTKYFKHEINCCEREIAYYDKMVVKNA